MKKSYPFISVVVLNYNGEHFLRQTIPPLLSIDYPRYEIIVIDNASTDASRQFLNRQDTVTVIAESLNHGCSRGKNIGVKAAQGDYILLLDEDILIKEPYLLHKLLKEYRNYSNIAFLSLLLAQGDSTMTTFYGGFLSLFRIYWNRPVALSRLAGRKSFPCASPDGGAMFFKKQTFMELGMFDESQPYYMDVGDIGLRAMIMGFVNYTYCESYAVHLGSSRKQETRQWCRKYQYCFSGVGRVITKNFSLPDFLLALPAFFLFMCAKTLKQAAVRLNPCVFFAFLVSIARFILQLRATLEERARVQAKRIKADDSFLKLKFQARDNVWND